MKRRDFIKGLVAAPFAWYLGKRYQIDVNVHNGDTVALDRWTGQTVYALGTTEKKYIPKLFKMHEQTLLANLQKHPYGQVIWRQKPRLITHRDFETGIEKYEVIARYAIV